MHRSVRLLTLAIVAALMTSSVVPTAVAQGRPGKGGKGAEAPAAPTGPQATKPFVKPLTAAQEQITKQDFEGAIATLDKADALPGKTPGDQYYIDNLKAGALLQLKRLPEAAAVYERVLEGGLLPADQAQRTQQLLARIYGGVEPRQWDKSAKYGIQYLESGGTPDREILDLVTIASYQAGAADKCEKALRYGEESLKIGGQEKPGEGVLQILQRCYAAAQDAANTNRVSLELVRNYPDRRAYWGSLTSNLKRESIKSDAQTLGVYRLIFELDMMDSAQEYMQMAQLARDAGFPGEAETVMRKGLASGTFASDADKKQGQQLLDDATRLAADDRKELPRLEAEAKAAKTGVSDVVLGEVFMTYGQDDKAVEALQRGIAKGGLKNADEANLLLGKALLHSGDGPGAAAAFAKVSGDLGRLGQVWGILATEGMPSD